MTYLITLIIVGLCFMGMAIGLIMAKKVLNKGCSIDPDSCACRRKGIPPEDCEEKTGPKSA